MTFSDSSYINITRAVSEGERCLLALLILVELLTITILHFFSINITIKWDYRVPFSIVVFHYVVILLLLHIQFTFCILI